QGLPGGAGVHSQSCKVSKGRPFGTVNLKNGPAPAWRAEPRGGRARMAVSSQGSRVMRAPVDRRSLLAAALGGAIGSALPLLGCARAAPANLTMAQLADGLVLISGAGGNVVAARGPEGAVMVDGGLAAHADQLA